MSTASPAGDTRPRNGASGQARSNMVPRLAAWLLRELDRARERWVLWLPVAFGAGIAVYFALPWEPPSWPALVGLLLAAIVMIALRGRAFGWLLGIGVLAFVFGFALAQLRSHQVAAPIIVRVGVSEHARAPAACPKGSPLVGRAAAPRRQKAPPFCSARRSHTPPRRQK